MQALWSRAGQAHHCGCKACFNAAGGMMRQSATRATRRKPTFSEVFTACYTSIMGTAAVLDAQKKDERRKELDRQLEEARAEFRMLVENAPSHLPRERVPDACIAPSHLLLERAPAGSITNRYKGALRRYKKQPEEIAEFFDSLGPTPKWPRVSPRSRQVKDIWHQYRLEPQMNRSYTVVDTDYKLLARFIRSEEIMTRIQHRIPTTSQQLEVAERKMRQLVTSLLRAGEARKTHDEARSEKCDSKALRRVMDDLCKSEHPHYDVDLDPNTVSRCSADLNRSLRDIFEEAQPSDIQPTILKVCYNLLVASQPPTIHTYNTLINGFSSAGLHFLASRVVKAFLRSTVEPTQSTLVCLLNHFKEANDREGFYKIIERMTGKDRRGINIRRKFVEQVHATDSLHKWAMTKDIAVNRDYVIERAWFDVRVLTAIIEGMLRFGYLRYAADTMALGFNLGFVFSMQAIRTVLNACVLELDPKPAIVILKAFASRPSLIEARFSKESHRAYIARRVQSLLYICGMFGITPATVVPSVEAVPASMLLSERHKRGLNIARITRAVDESEIKLEFFRSSLAVILRFLADCQSGDKSPTPSGSHLRPRRRLTKAAIAAAPNLGNIEVAKGLETSEEVRETVTISNNDKTTDSRDKADDAWAGFKDHFEPARSKPAHGNLEAAAGF
ncbi:Putative tetratricopeptide-like helical domain superfamily [Colletotrichum destructivum]|uniref:Tetratricopeptide-like helical domain superfamily n=1 Tax=Colletotrichum destructivum TaxID=34406 RepID=A0AAX4IFW8_9PEZI|nr:Putative tetratricopeptide-like helical domain superfamily [Colletotrichum destructivum]